LTEAQDALNYGGVRGAVNLLVRSGTYNERITFGEFYGSSATNTVTIQAESDNAADVILQYDSGYNSNDYYVLKLNGTDHLTFQHLTFEPLGGSYNRIIRLVNGTNHINISNCIFNGNRDEAIYATSAYQDLNITNNEFNNCRNDIYLRDNSSKRIYILDNIFNDNASQSGNNIYVYEPDSVFIHSNEIYSESNSSGIQVTYVKYVEIEKNQIYLQGTGAGLYVQYVDGDTERSRVINNVISTLGDGLYLYDVDDVNVYFNSVLTSSLNVGSHEAFYWRYCANADIRNNIITHEGGGYAANGYSDTGLVLDYNNYYSNGANIGKWNGTNISDFTAWQTTTTQDANSVFASPVFMSASDLHPNQALIDDAGVTIAGYTTDIDDTTRGTPPDMGAYEFTATGDNAGVISLLPETPFDPNTYPVTIELFNNGPSTLTSDSLLSHKRPYYGQAVWE